jgi:hypothetical protein
MAIETGSGVSAHLCYISSLDVVRSLHQDSREILVRFFISSALWAKSEELGSIVEWSGMGNFANPGRKTIS